MKRSFLKTKNKLIRTIACLLLASPGAVAFGANIKLYVDAAAAPGGTGSKQQPFHDVAAAIAAGRSMVSKTTDITISVNPGIYPVDSTIVIDYPVMLKGANASDFDVFGRPTGTFLTISETRLTGTQNLGVKPVIFVHPATGSAVVEDVTLANLIVEGTPVAVPGSITETVKLQKAQNFLVTDLVVYGVRSGTGIDVSASSGDVKKSFVTGVSACGICVSAGTAASPAVVNVSQNTSVQNGAGGLLLGGTAFPLVEPSTSLRVQVNNNSFSNNNTGGLGFGIRVFAIGQVAPAGQVSGQVDAQINGNTITDNRYGLMVDSGFTRRNALPWPSASCLDTRTFSGQLNVMLNANVITASTISPALVSFSRAQLLTAPASLQTNTIEGFQYLHGATIAISDPGLTLGTPGAFVVEHRLADPYVGGNCANDVVAEPLQNTFTYNGTAVPATL